MDTPLDNLDMEIFTDGSFFVRDGKLKAGYTMMRLDKFFFFFFFIVVDFVIH